MPKNFFPWLQALNVKAALRWLAVSILVGVLAGSASALLLWSLDVATTTRESHRWLIALLPLAGLFVGLIYHHLGSKVERGNALTVEQIHNPSETIQLRMTPLILLGTFITHLFGGSAGREGSALQTGASLADQLGKPFRLPPQERRMLLMAGLSAGFGSVFGVPWAGAIFGMEVLSFGHLLTPAIGPCIVASVLADYVTRAWHIHHTLYRVDTLAPLHPIQLLASAAAGIAFGLTAMFFAWFVHHLSARVKGLISYGPLRPALGGVLIAAAVFAMHTTRYIGLGVPVIVQAFHTQLPARDFALKSLFTIVTLGFGFKGGEVTPLFYIGATLGSALGLVLPIPFSLLAAMGFVAVFAGASKTPIASTIMAFELFGPIPGAFAAIACTVSWLSSGHLGIYGHRKKHTQHPAAPNQCR